MRCCRSARSVCAGPLHPCRQAVRAQSGPPGAYHRWKRQQLHLSPNECLCQRTRRRLPRALARGAARGDVAPERQVSAAVAAALFRVASFWQKDFPSRSLHRPFAYSYPILNLQVKTESKSVLYESKSKMQIRESEFTFREDAVIHYSLPSVFRWKKAKLDKTNATKSSRLRFKTKTNTPWKLRL